jgi:hypothetical protein
VRDADHQDNENLVTYFVHDSIVANADSPQFIAPLQLFGSMRTRVKRKRIDAFIQLELNFTWKLA